MDGLKIFIPITKIDEEKRLVYGTISQEILDKSGEMLDYESSKPQFQKWMDEQSKASNGKSVGNLRAMHGPIAAGIFKDIQFDDENKKIVGCAHVTDDQEWRKCASGTYTGFSIGGGYFKRWKDENGVQRFTPTLAETSLVDNPCVPTATFEYVKADGASEMRKFNTQESNMQKENTPIQGWQAADGSFHLTKASAIKHGEDLALKALTAPSEDALAKLEDAVSKAEGKKDDAKEKDAEKMDEKDETKKAKDAEATEDAEATKADDEKEDAKKDDAAEEAEEESEKKMKDKDTEKAVAADLVKTSSDATQPPADDLQKSESAERLEKLQAERDTLQKALESMAAKIDPLIKRIEHLEAQPAPIKGVMRTVKKGGETVSGAAADSTLDTMIKNGASPNECVQAVMKQALKHPVFIN